MADMVFKTKAMQSLEARLGRPLDSWLADRYESGATQEDIALELGVNRATISRYMTTFGIEARTYGPRPRRKAA